MLQDFLNYQSADIALALTFHRRTGANLPGLTAIQSCQEPIELRIKQHKSVEEPSGPRSLPVVGNHYEIYPDSLGKFDRLFARYGPMIKTVNFGTTTYHTNDPGIAKAVLREGENFTKTTSEPSHPFYYMQHQESLFTYDSDAPAFAPSHKFVPPALSPKAVAHHTPLIQKAAQSIFPVLDQIGDHQAFNVYQYMFKLAEQVIWQVVVDQDLHHFDRFDTPPAAAIKNLGEWLHLMKKTSLRPKWYGQLPFGDPVKLRKAKQGLWADVTKAVADCTAAGESMIELSKAAAEASRASCMANFLARARDKNGQGLPRELLISNVVILLGAGFTTSASLLPWCIFALTQYPGVQERLLQSIVDHGANGHRQWT